MVASWYEARMAVAFNSNRLLASLGFSGASFAFLRLADDSDEEISTRLEAKGQEVTTESITAYRHRAVVYAALASAASALVYLKSEDDNGG